MAKLRVLFLPMILAIGVTTPVPAQQASSVETLEEEAASLLSRYIQIDTTNPPGDEIKAARFFKEIFDREGIEARIIESAPGRGNLVARLDGGDEPALVLVDDAQWADAVSLRLLERWRARRRAGSTRAAPAQARMRSGLAEPITGACRSPITSSSK